MESTKHKETCFLTLTYDEDHLPHVYHKETDQWIPTLVKSHVQKWIRSVRRSETYRTSHLRYFAAGEYGSKKQRPHYHLILFGIGPLWTDLFDATWKQGFWSAYEATPASMAYVAKYCLKGGVDPELDLETLQQPGTKLGEDRVTIPPFRLMSRKPAIGATFAPNIAQALARDTGHGLLYDPSQSGPANQIRIRNKNYPLDTTMKKHLGEALVNRGVNHYMADAMLNRDYPEPNNEEIAKAARAHTKALRQRDTRTKL